MLDALTLRQLVEYDPATGVFLWKFREETSHFVVGWNKKFAGKIAGRKALTVYPEISLSGKFYYSHRLAWLYVTGDWPKFEIDHRDGDKTNNRFENLREATVSQNQCNRGAPRTNSVGRKGVYFYRATERYFSQIQIAKKRINLGYFATAEQAHQAYVEAAERHHGEFARTA